MPENFEAHVGLCPRRGTTAIIATGTQAAQAARRNSVESETCDDVGAAFAGSVTLLAVLSGNESRALRNRFTRSRERASRLAEPGEPRESVALR
jgi:hypothetical protein